MSSQDRTPRVIEPILAVLIALALALSGCNEKAAEGTAVFPETKSECQATAIPNSYVVHWRDGSVSVERGYTRDDFKRDFFDPNKSEIALAEQDQRVQIQPFDISAASVSETSPGESWGQMIVGAEEVWAAGFEGEGVTVAVVDSGMDLTHPQLRDRVAINTEEIPENGIDDDANGLIDDAKGWDFAADSSEVGDSVGHGTHVAGIIAADHSLGPVKGLAQKAKILPLNFMNSEGSGSIGDAILALNYAASRGARVVNASWGGTPCSQALSKSIADLAARNIVFVVAAGNSGASLDEFPEYPAAFTAPTQITVGASTARDYTAAFSNYSYRYVHLFAPGAKILSTWPGAKTAELSGTSMAAPFVSAAAALLIGRSPSATAIDVRAALLRGVDRGGFAASTQGRLNIPHAL